MPQLRIALAQVNTTVGDLSGNSDLVVEWTRRAASDGAHVVLFPVMALPGYPVEDLALRGAFTEASRAAVTELATAIAVAGHGDVCVVGGYHAAVDVGPPDDLPAMYRVE